MGNQAVLLLEERAFDLLPLHNLRLLERLPLNKIIINNKACWVTSALRCNPWEIWIHLTPKRCYQHHHPRWWDPGRMPRQRIRTERSVACNRHKPAPTSTPREPASFMLGGSSHHVDEDCHQKQQQVRGTMENLDPNPHLEGPVSNSTMRNPYGIVKLLPTFTHQPAACTARCLEKQHRPQSRWSSPCRICVEKDCLQPVL